MDKSLFRWLDSGYQALHLYGYYDGGNKITLIESGFDDAEVIIDALKPYSNNGN